MAEIKVNKKRLTINLSFFNTSTDQTNKSPKKFGEHKGLVGLGLVAALDDVPARAPVFSVSPRSDPIPIRGFGPRRSLEDVELCEEYTCVISHVGKNMIKKREYFGDGGTSGNAVSTTTSYWVSDKGFFFAAASSSPVLESGFEAEDFLTSCFLCKKQLHGLDIFMYRGEKAFCSVECREDHIKFDEHKEMFGSSTGMRKPHEYSISPCSGQMQFLAGMVAA